MLSTAVGRRDDDPSCGQAVDAEDAGRPIPVCYTGGLRRSPIALPELAVPARTCQPRKLLSGSPASAVAWARVFGQGLTVASRISLER